MAETDQHRLVMTRTIDTLRGRYRRRRRVYVSGNLLLYYVPGDKRRHVSPDVFVVFGVPNHLRKYYLLWEEAKGPDVAIEITSSSTRREDLRDKFRLYRDTLKVQEYFLFDPYGDYLKPPLQGYRLHDREYVAIVPVSGRLPSKLLGLHLERDGEQLRLFDPKTGTRLLAPDEEVEKYEAENERLRQQIARLRRQRGPQ